MATIKTPPKPSSSRALQPWEADLAAKATRQAAVEKPIGLFKRINIVGGHLFIDDKAVKGDEMDIVVLASTHENQWFNKPYESGTPAVPACYAFGDLNAEDPEAEMKPHPAAEDPQCETCADCEHNRMGSALTGKGKACGNVRRLIVTTPDALKGPKELKEAEARQLKIPVMSTRNWARYVNDLNEEVKRPPYGVVTGMSVVPDKKSLWQVLFEFRELITFDGPLYEAMKARVAAEEKNLVVPYPRLEEQEAPPPARGGKPAGKAPAPAKGAAPKKASKY